MISGELHELFRKDVGDTVAPYLWSEEEAYAYMNDAYVQFVRLTFGVSDVTSDVTQISVTAGEKYSELDPRILKIRKATLLSNNRPVKIRNAGDGDEQPGDLAPGHVHSMIIGEQDDLCRWAQVPVTDDTVALSVYRLPLNEITSDNDNFTDVRPHHHLHLMKWMKHLAYAKQDAETFDKSKSDQCKQEFEIYCAGAWREMERQRSKVRTVKYGGL